MKVNLRMTRGIFLVAFISMVVGACQLEARKKSADRDAQSLRNPQELYNFAHSLVQANHLLASNPGLGKNIKKLMKAKNEVQLFKQVKKMLPAEEYALFEQEFGPMPTKPKKVKVAKLKQPKVKKAKKVAVAKAPVQPVDVPQIKEDTPELAVLAQNLPVTAEQIETRINNEIRLQLKELAANQDGPLNAARVHAKVKRKWRQRVARALNG